MLLYSFYCDVAKWAVISLGVIHFLEMKVYVIFNFIIHLLYNFL